LAKELDLEKKRVRKRRICAVLKKKKGGPPLQLLMRKGGTKRGDKGGKSPVKIREEVRFRRELKKGIVNRER